MLCKYEP